MVKYKADPTIQDNTGNTTVHQLVKLLCSDKDFYRIVKTLISNGFAKVLTMKNREAQTPLELANNLFHINQHTKLLLRKHDVFGL